MRTYGKRTWLHSVKGQCHCYLISKFTVINLSCAYNIDTKLGIAFPSRSRSPLLIHV